MDRKQTGDVRVIIIVHCSSQLTEDDYSKQFFQSGCVQGTTGELLQPSAWEEHWAGLVVRSSLIFGSNLVK